jgi:hypothetical protein
MLVIKLKSKPSRQKTQTALRGAHSTSIPLVGLQYIEAGSRAEWPVAVGTRSLCSLPAPSVQVDFFPLSGITEETWRLLLRPGLWVHRAVTGLAPEAFGSTALHDRIGPVTSRHRAMSPAESKALRGMAAPHCVWAKLQVQGVSGLHTAMIASAARRRQQTCRLRVPLPINRCNIAGLSYIGLRYTITKLGWPGPQNKQQSRQFQSFATPLPSC